LLTDARIRIRIPEDQKLEHLIFENSINQQKKLLLTTENYHDNNILCIYSILRKGIKQLNHKITKNVDCAPRKLSSNTFKMTLNNLKLSL
jgi:hypothetical protein